MKIKWDSPHWIYIISRFIILRRVFFVHFRQLFSSLAHVMARFKKSCPALVEVIKKSAVSPCSIRHTELANGGWLRYGYYASHTLQPTGTHGVRNIPWRNGNKNFFGRLFTLTPFMTFLPGILYIYHDPYAVQFALLLYLKVKLEKVRVWTSIATLDREVGWKKRS